MAPECCNRKLLYFNTLADVQSFGGKAIDIWALGVTLYCMTFNCLPFWDEAEFHLFEKILNDQ